jgi:hypothetical protein
MRAQCIITYKTSRSDGVSSWKASVQGKDHVAIAQEAITKLKRSQRRHLKVIAIMVHEKSAV